MIDKCTFGGTYGALVLADKLNTLGDKKVNRKVSRSYHDFTKYLNRVSDIKDIQVYVHTMELLLKDKMHSITYDVDLPEDIKDYLRNCVKAAYRTNLLEALEAKTDANTSKKYQWLINQLNAREYRTD